MLSTDYVAAFIDAEGCFYADTKLRGSPMLDIANTDIDILNDISEFIVTKTSIKPRLRKVNDSNPNHSVSYHLIAGARILRIIMPELIDSLRVKKSQAIVVKQILDLTPEISGPGHPSNRTERESLTLKLQWLNQKCP